MSHTPKHCVCGTIGGTPLIRISDRLYAKLETLNPSGSIKDRMACYILDRAEERGEISPGDTIVEATSGNTGIAFSMLAATRGYKMIVVMPSDMSEERKRMIRSFDAAIVDVGPGDFAGAVEKRDTMVAELGAYCPRQFSNPDNVACHRNMTGNEIIGQVGSIAGNPRVAAFVAGTGTGGTLMGTRISLTERWPNMQTVAVEPTESAVMQHKEPGPHGIQGIGDGFIPPLVDMSVVDTVIDVSTDEAKARTQALSRSHGIFAGISAGANVLAAERYIEKHNPEGIVITILPDRQERYMSML